MVEEIFHDNSIINIHGTLICGKQMVLMLCAVFILETNYRKTSPKLLGLRPMWLNTFLVGI